MTLTKKDIVDEIYDSMEPFEFSRNKSAEAVDHLIDIMKSSLGVGEDILISGFGKFCVKDKKERRGRNPATGNDLMLAPRRVVTFKCSSKLRRRINNSG